MGKSTQIQFAAKDDCRAIDRSENGILWNALSDEKGKLHSLVSLVNNKPDIELCFRGNSSTDSITVYYNNNQFVRFYVSDGKIVSQCNKNHSRYYYDRDNINAKIVEELKNPGNFEKFYKLRKKVMQSYFDEKDNRDYIKDPIHGELIENKNCKYEKQEQQKLMTANVNRENGYYIYDMEYAQAFESQTVKELYEEKTKEKKHNKPDSLAIRYENGKPVALVFVELKTTLSAMTGNSSAINHMEGMRNFIDWDKKYNNEQFIKNRRIEAQKVMEEYKLLGLHGCGTRKIENFDKLPVELLLVITGNVYPNLPYNETARAYFENVRVNGKIKGSATKNKCRIIVLEPNEFELKYENILK